jgi:hypothetical protein
MAAGVSLLTGISLLFPDLALNRIWDLNKAAYIAFQRLGGASGFLLLAVGALRPAHKLRFPQSLAPVHFRVQWLAANCGSVVHPLDFFETS